MSKKLSPEQIQDKTKRLEGWHADPETAMLQKEYEFENFSDAMVFVNKVAEIAEEMNHHPDICVSYNTVVIMLTTHDVGGLTEKDIDSAKRIEALRLI